MINSRNNVYSLLSSLLEEYHYNIFRSDWDKEVKRMNFSPTLPMISQMLMTFGVDNFIAKVPSDKISWFFSNFSTKPHILYEGAIFLRKFNIKN